jgi:Protein of unknown function (DUF998)
MQQTFANNVSNRSASSTPLTKLLLSCAVIAGPFYLVVGLIQAFTRPGFDITRHDLSLLSNGSLGWIHITNLIVTGLLVIVGAVGIKRALGSRRSGNWVSLLIGIYGLGLIGAGIFVADPALGFPLGTPADTNTISPHGFLHFVCGGLGFLAFIAACFVFARRFATLGQRGWQTFSVATGLIFLAGFFGIASGSGNPLTLLGFWIAVVLAWVWLSAVANRLRQEISR